jgi:hypothetical protein
MSPITSEECKFLADKHPDKFFWFCDVDPRAFPNTKNGDIERIVKHYKKLGAKGVGELTAHIYADDDKLMNLYSAKWRRIRSLSASAPFTPGKKTF